MMTFVNFSKHYLVVAEMIGADLQQNVGSFSTSLDKPKNFLRRIADVLM